MAPSKIILQLGSNFPSSWVAPLKAATNTWNTAATSPIFYIGKSYPYGSVADGRFVISVPQVWSFKSNVQGMTTIRFHNYNQIIDADIVLNKHYNFTIKKPTNLLEYDLESLLLHELGHVLGMKHSFGTVMSPWLGRGEVRDRLTTWDKQRLHCHY